jgi:PST family polysaccharide transporter
MMMSDSHSRVRILTVSVVARGRLLNTKRASTGEEPLNELARLATLSLPTTGELITGAVKPTISSAFTGAFWQYSSYFLQALAQFLVLTVLSRLLSAGEFGLISISMVFINLSALFSQLGVGPALIQRKEIVAQHVNSAFTISLIMGFIFFVVIYISSPSIAVFFGEPILREVMRWIGCVFIFSGFGVVSESLLTRHLRFRALLVSNILSYVIGYAICGIVCAYFGLGVWSLVIANLVQNLVRSIIMYASMPHSLKFYIHWNEARELMNFGAGFTMTRLFNYGATEGDRFVIGKMLSVMSVGVYSRAYNLMMVMANQFGATLEKVIFPVMAAYQQDKTRLQSIYLSASSAVTFFTLPISIVFILYAPEIVRVVLGPGWQDVILPFQLLTVSMTFRTAYKIGDSVAKAMGFVYQRSIREFIYAVFVVAGTYLGCKLGLVGAASAVSLSIFLNFFMSTAMGCRITGLSRMRFLRSQLPGMLIGLITLGLALSVRRGLLEMGVSGPGVLFLGGGLVGIVLLAIIWLAPWLIGAENRHLVQLIHGQMINNKWIARGLAKFI